MRLSPVVWYTTPPTTAGSDSSGPSVGKRQATSPASRGLCGAAAEWSKSRPCMAHAPGAMTAFTSETGVGTGKSTTSKKVITPAVTTIAVAAVIAMTFLRNSSCERRFRNRCASSRVASRLPFNRAQQW